jgi:tRNA(adenine34) deaminase
MMAQCVQLARGAVDEAEHPFASIIVRQGAVVAEATNQLRRQADQSRHAEIVVIAEARRLLGTNHLDDRTLYSIVEPCPMWHFA